MFVYHKHNYGVFFAILSTRNPLEISKSTYEIKVSELVPGMSVMFVIVITEHIYVYKNEHRLKNAGKAYHKTHPVNL